MIGCVIRTIVSRMLLLLIMIILLIPVGILLLLPEKMRYDSLYARWLKRIFYWCILRGSFLPISIEGKENIPNDPAIIVANHQSSLDIPLIGSLLGCFPHVWLATKDLMQSPILRWILPQVAILVDISSPIAGMRSLVRAFSMIMNQQRHVIIFPEGGRYADGHVHPFYGGFVMLAKKTHRPVVPILICDAYRVYPRGAFLVYYHPIRLVIGKPIVRTADESDAEFKNRIRAWFLDATRNE